MSDTVFSESRHSVGYIQLNRPKALNALNTDMMQGIVSAAQGFDADPDIGCIVISGSEKAFAAGADITEMSQMSATEMYTSAYFSGWEDLTRVRIPIIAAVSGYALGGGCELAMMCDIIIAADNATFGQPEINLGIFPGMGGTQRLTKAIGKATAMDMILTGRRIDAQEAERVGLVSRVVPAAELQAEVTEVAELIASKSRVSTMMAKEAVNASFDTPLAQGVNFERRLFYSAFASEDQAEGMAAFTEKRDPEFRGR